MNVLLTGSSGFVGSVLNKKLLNNDFNIFTTTRNKNNVGSKVLYCDFLEEAIPSDLLENIDIVFHLAGFAHNLQGDKKTEHLYKKINLEATISLIDMAVKKNVKKFVFISSVKAGGLPNKGNCSNEEDQNIPDGVYGETKLKAEKYLLKIGKKNGMHVSVIRPSLVYGFGMKGNLKLMLSRITKGFFPPLPETFNRRSMVHVDDLVESILIISNSENTNGEVYIVTDGINYSSRNLYDAMCIAAGKKIPAWSVPKFLFDIIALTNPRIKYKINKLFGDECYSSKKLNELGFKPQRTLKDINETSF